LTAVLVAEVIVMLRLVPLLFLQERGQHRGESWPTRSHHSVAVGASGGNDLIQADILVLAKDGRPSGLTQSDFTVIEERKAADGGAVASVHGRQGGDGPWRCG
jgi:hypothetical protein